MSCDSHVTHGGAPSATDSYQRRRVLFRVRVAVGAADEVVDTERPAGPGIPSTWFDPSEDDNQVVAVNTDVDSTTFVVNADRRG